MDAGQTPELSVRHSNFQNLALALHDHLASAIMDARAEDGELPQYHFSQSLSQTERKVLTAIISGLNAQAHLDQIPLDLKTKHAPPFNVRRPKLH